MKYIIITVVAILVNAIIMYMLGNKIVGLRFKSLMMCGFSALVLSLVLPTVIVSVTSLAGKIVFYAIFAIISAGFVVYYDDMKEGSSQFRLSTATEVGADSLSNLEDFRKNELKDNGIKVGINTMLVDSVTENVELAKPFNSPSGLVNEVETLTTFETSESQLYSELILEPTIAYKVLGISSILGTATANIEAIISSETINSILAQKKFCADDLKLKSKPKGKLHKKFLALDNSKSTKHMGIARSPIELELAPLTLDELLECAFSYKERGEDSYALAAFRCALKLHRDKEIAPLLVIEIANLLKNEGAYDEAIALLIQNRNLLGLDENYGLDQDFVNTIAYLRIIKNTLSENYLSYIPISKIPEDILKKIDDEFHIWRKSI